MEIKNRHGVDYHVRVVNRILCSFASDMHAVPMKKTSGTVIGMEISSTAARDRDERGEPHSIIVREV